MVWFINNLNVFINVSVFHLTKYAFLREQSMGHPIWMGCPKLYKQVSCLSNVYVLSPSYNENSPENRVIHSKSQRD